MVGHGVSSCSKLSRKPECGKCGKCGGGDKIENCGFKCSYCFGLGHTKERCWKKNGKGFTTITNYLEVSVNDEKATLTELNQLCGIKNNIFLGTKVPMCKNPIIVFEVDKNEKKTT
jgi:hypothetical protein